MKLTLDDIKEKYDGQTQVEDIIIDLINKNKIHKALIKDQYDRNLENIIKQKSEYLIEMSICLGQFLHKNENPDVYKRAIHIYNKAGYMHPHLFDKEYNYLKEDEEYFEKKYNDLYNKKTFNDYQ